MKIKCIEVGNKTGITLNKIYEIIKEQQDYYHIKNDNNEIAHLYKSRFKVMYSIEEIINGKFLVEIDNEEDWNKFKYNISTTSHYYGHKYYSYLGYYDLDCGWYKNNNYRIIKFNQIEFMEDEQLKIEKKIKCIDNVNATYILTLNKIYEVIGENNHFWIINDENEKDWFKKDRFEVVKEKLIKINTIEKQVIGYKLIKPEYTEAVLKIEVDKFISLEIRNGQILYSNYTESVNKLREAGVLDLWFEPVYSEEFKNGDWVYIENTEKGAFGAKGKVGKITDKIGNAGLSKPYPSSTVKVEVGNSVWIIGKTFNSVKLRFATKEEIQAAQTVIIPMTASNGDFEIEVSKDKIFYRPDNKELPVKFIKEIIDWFDDTSKHICDSNHLIYSLKVESLTVGCKQGTQYSDWKKVLDVYNNF